MSGTAYGCHVQHITPEAAAGGPLALVQNGDWITLDAANGTLVLEIEEADMEVRSKNFRPAPPPVHSPWGLIHGHPELGVHQAHLGAYLKIFDSPLLAREDIRRKLREPLRPQH
jgi:dihydroxyacid dehydratase/phosphogluconate dehydratase